MSTELVQPYQRKVAPQSEDNTIPEEMFNRLHIAWLELQLEEQKMLRIQDQLQAQATAKEVRRVVWNGMIEHTRQAQGRAPDEVIDMTNRIWVSPPKE